MKRYLSITDGSTHDNVDVRISRVDDAAEIDIYTFHDGLPVISKDTFKITDSKVTLTRKTREKLGSGALSLGRVEITDRLCGPDEITELADQVLRATYAVENFQKLGIDIS